MDSCANNCGRVVSLGAALVGSVAGPIFLSTWGQLGAVSDVLIVSVLGFVIGAFPGWSAGLLALLIMEKRHCSVGKSLLPALISFPVSFTLAGILVPWCLWSYANAMGGL